MSGPRQCKRSVQRLAGTVVLSGLVLAWLVNTWFVAITAFAGLNLLQSSFTGVCPAEWLLSSCGDETEESQPVTT